MKIFLNLLAATSGGQLSRASAFLDRFDNFSRSSKLIVVKEKNVLTEYSSKKNRSIFNIPIGFSKLKIFKRLLWENFIMSRLIHDQEADVYLTFSHYLPFVNLKIPSVVGVSNLAPFSDVAWEHESSLVKLKMAILKRTIISSCKRANYVLALSELGKHYLIKNKIEEKKILITSNGVDKYWNQPTPQTNLFNKLKILQPFILYVSHFHYYKNHHRLIQAFSELPEIDRDSHQLVLVGRPVDKSCYRSVIALIRKYKLNDRIIVIPGETKSNLRELYQRSKLFIFPSLIENSPSILLEAMMAGSNILCSKFDPMPEFGSSSIRYFDPTNTFEMMEKMKNAISHSGLQNELKDKAYQQACKFSWSSFTSRVINQAHLCLKK